MPGENQEFAVDVNKEIQDIVKQYEEDAAVHIAEYKEAFLETGGTEEELSKKDIKVDVSYEVVRIYVWIFLCIL